jgi:methionyl-tRNA formyltransferase
MRIVFCGTGAIGVPSFHALLLEHEVVGVFTQPDKPAGRDLKLRPSPVKVAAEAAGVPVFQPARIREAGALAELAALAPDVMIVAAYGQILPAAVLNLPRLGCLNVHASLLPRHRGASPVNAALLAGDAETGITIMSMDEGLDTGDILLQAPIAIGAAESAGALHDRLAVTAPALLLEALRLIEKGCAPRIAQDATRATYAPKLKKTDGAIAWNRPAAEIDRQIRGLTPWPGAFTALAGRSEILKIHKASPAEGRGTPGAVISSDGTGLTVAAGDGAILLEEVQLPGKKRMPAAQFALGYTLASPVAFEGPGEKQ